MPLSLAHLPSCKSQTTQLNESSSAGGSSPKRVVRDSAASRKSLVGMALSLFVCTGTSLKVLCSVSNQVPPDGKGTLCGTAMICVEGFQQSVIQDAEWKEQEL